MPKSASPRSGTRGRSKRLVKWIQKTEREIALASRVPRNYVGEDGLERFATGLLRRFVFERDAGQCLYCGILVRFEDFVTDHVVPYPAGATEPQNLVVACRECNRLKGVALIPEHLRPDTSGDFDVWFREWQRRPTEFGDPLPPDVPLDEMDMDLTDLEDY